MSRYTVKSEEITKRDKQDYTWERLIEDAENEIEQARKRVTALRKSIRFFEEQQANGKPCPLAER